MSNVTEAVLEYILPRLTHAERLLVAAESEVSPSQDYLGFELALKAICECRRAIDAEPTRDSAAALGILNKARATLAQLSSGAAGPAVIEARTLIDESTVILYSAA